MAASTCPRSRQKAPVTSRTRTERAQKRFACCNCCSFVFHPSCSVFIMSGPWKPREGFRPVSVCPRYEGWRRVRHGWWNLDEGPRGVDLARASRVCTAWPQVSPPFSSEVLCLVAIGISAHMAKTHLPGASAGTREVCPRTLSETRSSPTASPHSSPFTWTERGGGQGTLGRGRRQKGEGQAPGDKA